MRTRYNDRQLRSTDRVALSLKHLEKFFDDWPLPDIDGSAVERYTDSLREKGASNASVNRETSALRFGLGLLEKKFQICIKSYSKTLEDNGIRQGFGTQADLCASSPLSTARCRVCVPHCMEI